MQAAYYTTEDPEVCERCGTPIKYVTLITNDDGEEHIYGSTCGQRMMGNAIAERETRKAMESHRQRNSWLEQTRHKVGFHLELEEWKQKLREEKDPIRWLHLQYEFSQWKREQGL